MKTGAHAHDASALFDAAQRLDLKALNAAIAAGAQVDGLVRGMTPLFAACARSVSDLAVVQALLDAGADPNAGEVGLPLHQAVAMRHAEVVEALIRGGADVNRLDASGQTPLVLAAAGPGAAFVKRLLDTGADANVRDKHGATALAHALKAKNQAAVDLLRAVTEPGESAERPWRSGAPGDADALRLVRAAEAGDVQFVRALLERGADPDAAGEYGERALHKAAEQGHVDVLDALLRGGADLEARGSTGETPLIRAANRGELICVERLLRAGANANARAADGCTPLHAHIGGGQLNVEILDLLIGAGADVNAVDGTFRMTPLHWVAEHGRRAAEDVGSNVVERLFRAGADPAVRDGANEWTPFERAAAHANLAIVRTFVARNAHVSQKVASGASAAAGLARRWGDDEVAEYLQSIVK